MKKMKMHSLDQVDVNVQKILEIFPECTSEVIASDGSIVRTVNFDLLKQELSKDAVDLGQERYQLNWAGKREALISANSPIAKVLRPSREESVDFDSTKNLYIEGDNLEALKLLQETYLNKVKMIYIDPPYNTGSDFIYEDDFSEDSQDYLMRSNQVDASGNKLVANNESNGRFHSSWLSMIYPRLKLARNLLSDDGVIFISIDDCEYANLKKLCDELFGEHNFYCTFVWKRRSGAMDSVDNTSSDHEYVLCYGKQKSKLAGIGRTYEGYSNPDNDPRGPWKADNLSAGKSGGDVHYPIQDPLTGNSFLPPEGRYWPYSRKTMAEKIADGRIIFPAKVSGRPMLKRFKNEAKFETVPVSTWMVQREEDRISNSLVAPANTQGTRELQDIFDAKIFPHPKSTRLVESLASQCLVGDGDIVLDFFSGSATTAHAIMNLNAKDGGNRRFIMIQVTEDCDSLSEAYKAGYKTIPQIGRERIRRVSSSIKERIGGLAYFDAGFRVLKVDSSNMSEVYYNPDAISQDLLSEQEDNVRSDRTAEDLLFQVLLDWGVDLSLPISNEMIQEKSVFFVDQNALVACFDKQGGVDEDFVKELAKRQPLRVVFRDAGFKSDSVKINVEQIFKLLSPSTEVKCI